MKKLFLIFLLAFIGTLSVVHVDRQCMSLGYDSGNSIMKSLEKIIEK